MGYYKISVQAFPLQCLPTHHGGSVYAGTTTFKNTYTDKSYKGGRCEDLNKGFDGIFSSTVKLSPIMIRGKASYKHGEPRQYPAY